MKMRFFFRVLRRLPEFFLLGLIGCLFQCSHALAETLLPAPPSTGRFQERLSFRDLQMEKNLDMGPDSADRTLQVGVAPDKLVENASLRLLFRLHSPFFQKSRNTLAVEWNGVRLGKIAASPGESGETLAITFPVPAYLVNTRNILRLRVVRDPKNPCALFGSAPFVTVLRQSSIDIHGTRIGVPPRLSNLPFPFLYPDAAGLRRIPFVLTTTASESLEAAGIIASWLGVRAPYLPFHFPVTVSAPLLKTSFPPGHLILVALGRDLPPNWLPSPVKGPLLMIRPNPEDPFSRILVISGRTPADLRMAALYLSENQFSGTGNSFSPATVLPPPRRLPDDAPRWQAAGNTLRFGWLETPESLRVHGTGSVRVHFSLPPDLFTWNHKWIRARVRFRIRTEKRENRSKLDIFLNDRYQESLALPSSGTGILERTVEVPLSVSDLTPFANRLDFNFNFRNSYPSVISCSMDQNPRLEGTILPDSSLDLRPFSRYTILPDLKLFPNGGYPFTRYADLSGTGVVLPDSPGPSDIGMFLHMMAMFGAQTGLAASRVRVATPKDIENVRSRNLILLGTYRSNPLLLRLTRTLPHVSNANLERLKDENLLMEILRWNNPPPAHFGPSDLVQEFRKARNPLGVILETVSPFAPRRVALSVIGVSQKGLFAMDNVLFDPRHFSGIFGDVTVVEPDGLSSFFLPASSFASGSTNPLEQTRFWFASHPVGIVASVIVLASVTGFSLRTLLGARAKNSPDVLEEKERHPE